MLPPVIPPLLLGSHITIVWAIVLLTQLGGILGHSAFMLPVVSNRFTTLIPFLNSEYHDLHHLRYNVNYGAVWPLVDMLFGTYREEPIVYKHGVEPELAAAAGVAYFDDSDDDDDDDSDGGSGGREGGHGGAQTAGVVAAAISAR